MKRNVDVVYTNHMDEKTHQTHILSVVKEDMEKQGLIPDCCVLRKSVWEEAGGWLEGVDNVVSNLDFWNRYFNKNVVFAKNEEIVIVPDLSSIRIYHEQTR